MPYLGKSGLWESDTIENLAKHRFTIPITGKRLVDTSADDGSLRVLIMAQADEHYTKETLRFHFKKIRKIEHCKNLLRRVGIPFVVQTNSDQTTVISVRRRDMPMWLRTFRNKRLGWWLLNESADIVFDELVHWDGYRSSTNSIQYTSTVKENADVIQALACLSGRTAVMLTKRRPVAEWSTTYVVNIWTSPGKGHDVRIEYVSQQHYAGRVYCAETKTGYFLTRRDGKVWITGNSGQLIQGQNLSRNYLRNLDLARDLVRRGNREAVALLFGDVGDTLSQLIRTAIIAPEGKLLCISDFSAIEARVLAWLAGEKWVLEAFDRGEDIYCATASSMFHVPVEKHGANSHLRQKGKIAVLASGYQGGPNALISMGALKMGLKEDELPDIVDRWRKANPRIVDFWQKVENAALYVMNTARPVGLDHGILFARESNPADGSDFLTITLPSGRKLFYPSPHLAVNAFDREALHYRTQIGANWGTSSTYGGKLTENITQAVARDCLAAAITRLTKARYRIIMHVHDEVVIEIDETDPEETLAEVNAFMCDPLPWAQELHLTAAGFISKYYRKD